ncbi:MAG: polysaccharide lyase [Deltaproteobacteria bacterium]|nr:polysaccharide lyase [Deltaproteobacteria bacterium]
MSIHLRRYWSGLSFAALALCATPAAAEPIWSGDFETGDLSQWIVYPQVVPAPERVTIVEDPVREGQYACRVEIRPEDLGVGDLNRQELTYQPDYENFEGTEAYYSLSLMIEQELVQDWHLPWYWEGDPFFVQAMGLSVFGAQLQFQTGVPQGSSVQHWGTAFTPGVWHDFVFHILWSPDPAVGFVEVYYGGEVVVPTLNVATMHSSGGDSFPNFMKVGMIRSDLITETEVIYIDGVRAGTTLEDVLPDGGGATTGGADETGGNAETGANTSGAVSTGAEADAGSVTPDTGGDDLPPATGTGGVAADGGDTDSGGCGCRNEDAPAGPLSWSWLGLWLLVRRRR